MTAAEVGPPTRAAEEGPVESIHFLIEHGADPSVTDDRGWAALHHAAEQSRPAQVEALIQAGADVNQLALEPGWNPIRGPQPGTTPLDLAASKGAIDCVKILLKHGAKIDGNPPESSRSALHHAVLGRYITEDESRRKSYEQLKRLYERGLTKHYPQPGISYGNWEVITELLVHGASLSDRDYLGDQPIHRCVTWGALDTLTFLLENYAGEIDVNSPGSYGRTPLQIVAFEFHGNPRQGNGLREKVIRLLLAHGADPSLTTDQWRKTPYEIALETQKGPTPVSETVLKLLRPADAATEQTTHNGEGTPP